MITEYIGSELIQFGIVRGTFDDGASKWYASFWADNKSYFFCNDGKARSFYIQNTADREARRSLQEQLKHVALFETEGELRLTLRVYGYTII
jgi:hypothetical protein